VTVFNVGAAMSVFASGVIVAATPCSMSGSIGGASASTLSLLQGVDQRLRRKTAPGI
jgi:hypothetical protein